MTSVRFWLSSFSSILLISKFQHIYIWNMHFPGHLDAYVKLENTMNLKTYWKHFSSSSFSYTYRYMCNILYIQYVSDIYDILWLEKEGFSISSVSFSPLKFSILIKLFLLCLKLKKKLKFCELPNNSHFTNP